MRRSGMPRVIPVGLGVLAVAALSFFILATQVKSPAQTAATARPPAPSVITAPIQQQVLSQSVVFRGNVLPGISVTVPTPALPSGSVPVVTALDVKLGQAINFGQVLAGVAGRPIIALPGAIGAYRTMQVGDDGVDVRQLQLALIQLGFGVGGDALGSYGPATADAVERLYRHVLYEPMTQQPNGASSAGSAPTASSDASALAGQPSSTGDPVGVSTPSTASNSSNTGSNSSSPSVASTTTTSTTPGPATTTTTTIPPKYATVPLGEVVFVPTLPATVESIDVALGRVASGASNGDASAGSGSSGSDSSSPTSTSTTPPLMTLGSGGVLVTGEVDQADTSTLRVGMAASLNDDTTGGHWSGTLSALGSVQADSNGVPQAAVTVSPVQSTPIPLSEIGQNIRVRVTAASTSGPVLTVPISAVYSRTDGRSYVTEARGSARTLSVAVSVGLDESGIVQVTPVGAPGALKPGNRVIVGASRGTGGAS